MNSYPVLDAQTQFGPTYLYEYSTREAYGTNITWGVNEPLNATWWHHVTERASAYPFRISLLIPFSASRDGSEPCSRFGATEFPSLRSVIDQLMPLVKQTFTNFQGKQSVRMIPCNTEQCIKAKICYMRSGSSSIAVQNCQSGFGSVQ